MDSRRVGILGGGQLGRMTAEAGHRLGIEVAILDPAGALSPAGQVVKPGLAIEGSFQEASKIQELAAMCDVITVEIEHVNCDALEALEQQGRVVHPSSHVLKVIQDKFLQKEFIKPKVPAMPDYRGVGTPDEARACGKDFGYPFMLKARKGAYDGRGNYAVRSEEEVDAAWTALGGEMLYIEKWCEFDKELAVMVARNQNGEVVAYPVVETVQQNSICHRTLCPAAVPQAVLKECAQVARDAILALPNAVGIFGVELFYKAGQPVLLNEIAPRPHNSGHFTMESCGTCQFEMHLRAVLGLPMAGADLIVGCSLMQNILGCSTLDETIAPLTRCLGVAGTGVHWYAKQGDVKRGRKMGHFTISGATSQEVADKLRAVTAPSAEEEEEIRRLFNSGVPQVGVIMGSDSDLPAMSAACKILDQFQVPYEVTIVSAHRTPQRLTEYASSAVSRGLRVVIAGAGGAAHLPGMVAAQTPLPVVGVPIRTSALNGVDSLHSIVQMPRGVPVATVAIGNATNAGLLAVKMIACGGDSSLLGKLEAYSAAQEQEVMDKVERLEAMGYEEYLAAMESKSSIVM